MKKIYFIIVCGLLNLKVSAQISIHNFEELMSALKSGKSVKTVIYYGKCKLFSDGIEEKESVDANRIKTKIYSSIYKF